MRSPIIVRNYVYATFNHGPHEARTAAAVVVVVVSMFQIKMLFRNIIGAWTIKMSMSGGHRKARCQMQCAKITNGTTSRTTVSHYYRTFTTSLQSPATPATGCSNNYATTVLHSQLPPPPSSPAAAHQLLLLSSPLRMHSINPPLRNGAISAEVARISMESSTILHTKNTLTYTHGITTILRWINISRHGVERMHLIAWDNHLFRRWPWICLESRILFICICMYVCVRTLH